ncbi:MAG: hypothetical protein AAGJ32_06595 [Pseudomonadota bacterium]
MKIRPANRLPFNKPLVDVRLAQAVALGAAMTAAMAAPAAFAMEKGADAFAAMDANGDAIVTEAEFVAYATSKGSVDPEGAKLRFEVLAGQDGQLTETEFTDAMAVLESRDAADEDSLALSSPRGS